MESAVSGFEVFTNRYSEFHLANRLVCSFVLSCRIISKYRSAESKEGRVGGSSKSDMRERD